MPLKWPTDMMVKATIFAYERPNWTRQNTMTRTITCQWVHITKSNDDGIQQIQACSSNRPWNSFVWGTESWESRTEKAIIIKISKKLLNGVNYTEKQCLLQSLVFLCNKKGVFEKSVEQSPYRLTVPGRFFWCGNGGSSCGCIYVISYRVWWNEMRRIIYYGWFELTDSRISSSVSLESIPVSVLAETELHKESLSDSTYSTNPQIADSLQKSKTC